MPIYNPDNFRGDVFCDGNEINECIWVDTDRGIAEYVPKPPRVKTLIQLLAINKAITVKIIWRVYWHNYFLS